MSSTPGSYFSCSVFRNGASYHYSPPSFLSLWRTHHGRLCLRRCPSFTAGRKSAPSNVAWAFLGSNFHHYPGLGVSHAPSIDSFFQPSGGGTDKPHHYHNTQLSVVAVKDRIFDEESRRRGGSDSDDSSGGESGSIGRRSVGRRLEDIFDDFFVDENYDDDYDFYDDYDEDEDGSDDDSSYRERWKRRRIEEMIEGVGRGQELRVEALTDLFAPDNLGRHRDLVDPDQSYAAIFQLDGVVLDMAPLRGALWAAVATEFGLPQPTEEQVAESMGLEPALAVARCFQWAPMGSRDAEKYALVHAQVQQRVMTSSDIREGLLDKERLHRGAARADLEGGEENGQDKDKDEDDDEEEERLVRLREAVAAGQEEDASPEARRLSTTAMDELATCETKLALRRLEVQDGFQHWISQLRQSRVPVAIVSSYPQVTMEAALKAAGLWGQFFADGGGDGENNNGAYAADPAYAPAAPPAAAPTAAAPTATLADPGLSSMPPSQTSGGGGGGGDDENIVPVQLVCSDTGFNRLEQLYLGASLQLERPPQKCAIFDTSPAAMMAAHEADMRAVAVLTGGMHKPYELGVADMKVDDLGQLSMMNLRGLFANRDYPWDLQPEPQLQTLTAKGSGGGRFGKGSRWADPYDY